MGERLEALKPMIVTLPNAADDDEGGATDEGGPRGKEGAEKLTGTDEDA